VIAEGIPSAIKEHESQLNETRTAIVVSEDNWEEVSRLYDLLRSALPTTVRLFGDMDDARAWLGLGGASRRSERRVAPRRAVEIAVRFQTATEELLSLLGDPF